MKIQPGETVGDYEVLEVLGTGGMGRVYRARHRVTERVEAIKVLAHQHTDNDEKAQRFLREARVHASLAHPNIASVHTAFWWEDNLILVMELVEGVPLKDILARGPLPETQALSYVRQTLDALEYAHSQGVIHRDITPANILITPEGKVKLTDFGLAKTVHDARLTQTGTPMGSLYYISPEQVRGTAAPDVRSDLYSLGAVLYEMVTGRTPFVTSNPFDLMESHVNHTPDLPARVNPELSGVWNGLILRSLEKNPGKRFQTAAEFREALALRETRRGSRRWRWALPVSGVAAAGIFAMASWLVNDTNRRLSQVPPLPPVGKAPEVTMPLVFTPGLPAEEPVLEVVAPTPVPPAAPRRAAARQASLSRPPVKMPAVHPKPLVWNQLPPDPVVAVTPKVDKAGPLLPGSPVDPAVETAPDLAPEVELGQTQADPDKEHRNVFRSLGRFLLHRRKK